MDFGIRRVLVAAFALLICGCFMPGRGPVDPYAMVSARADDAEIQASREAMSRAPESEEAARGAFILAREALYSGDVAGMDKSMEWLEKHQPASTWLAPIAYVRILAAKNTEGVLPLLNRIESSISRFPEDGEFRKACHLLISPALESSTRSDLETFLADVPSGALTPNIMLALGRLNFREGRHEEASTLLRALVVRFPDSAASLEAFPLLAELSREIPTESTTIGALLPTTGPYSRYGKLVRQSIALAVEDMQAAGHQFTFAVVDTKRDPERALQGFIKLVTERKVVAVFGPLFSATALLCAAEANTHGVVMLTPSALATGLTQTGPYVFRAVTTPDQEGRTMAHFAMQNGFERFGILAPDSPYGRARAEVFRSEVSALGGTIVAESFYPADSPDFSDSIVAIGGADKLGFKDEEEEFHRIAQYQLEIFLRQFFDKAEALLPAITSGSEYATPDTGQDIRTACLILSADPFSHELGQRLHAAALPYRTINVLSPTSVTEYASGLKMSVITGEDAPSEAETQTLAELLSHQVTEHESPFTVLISVETQPSPPIEERETELPLEAVGSAPAGTLYLAADSGSGSDSESVPKLSDRLNCAMAMYDSRLGRRLAAHRFTITRPLPPPANRMRLDAIYVPATGLEVERIMPQLRYHGMDLALLGSEAWNDEALQARPESFVMDSYFTVSFWPTLDRGPVRDFVERYQTRYAEPPDFLAANAYDAARVLMTAAIHSDGSREDLRRSLLETGRFDGISGSLTFTPEREVDRQLIILKVSDGTISPVQ